MAADKTIHVVLDWRIRLPWGQLEKLPEDAQQALGDALWIPNREREEAKKQHIYGWQKMEEFLPMFEEGPEAIDIARGYLLDLQAGVEHYGFRLEIDDQTKCPKVLRKGKQIAYRDHQGEPVQDILHQRQGMYKAPPGAGKTAVILSAGRLAQTRNLIIVNTKDILNQWVDRIHEHLSEDIQVGVVGGGKFKPGYQWTVATAQTLDSRFDQLEAEGFFDEFGLVCVDECHHSTANSYQRAINRFSAKYRLGVSATPDKTGDFELAKMVLGPIISTTEHDGLVDKGYLIDPTIIKVKTDFSFDFVGTTSRWQRSNYPQLLKDLVVDPKRNAKIVKAIKWEEGHHCLVLTKRHEHIDILEDLLLSGGYGFPTARLTGKESNAERTRVIQLLGNEPSCVFSTIADEALDVPRVDRGFLAYPQKNVGLLDQQTGRYCRTHPLKRDAKIYDFADLLVSPLASQWRGRYRQLYQKRGWTVEAPPWEADG